MIDMRSSAINFISFRAYLNINKLIFCVELFAIINNISIFAYR